jgi:iron complex outermembrane receptor protein
MGTTSRNCLRSALLAGIAVLSFAEARAQDAPVALDDVNVNATRIFGNPTKPAQISPAPQPQTTTSPTTAVQPTTTGQTAFPIPTNLAGSGILTNTLVTGASSTVITAEDIRRSPGTTIQDVLQREAGINTSSLFGGVNGALTGVDLRGFGVTAAQNTLILINGRRVTDLDLAGVDLSTLPKDSIERIEITRGNSAAVLYGDNAIGGVVNIITKTSAGVPPWARIEGGFGSFNQTEGAVSAGGSWGPWSTSVFMNGIRSDGYRDNNQLKQLNGTGEIRYTVRDFSAFLNISGDDQRLGLPGGRLVDPTLGINQLVTDRRGATTPFDYANKQGINATTGFNWQLDETLELVVDGGVRHKTQQAGFFGTFVNPAAPDPMNYIDAKLTTWSITPRINVQRILLGMPTRATFGVDFYYADFNQDRSLQVGAPPYHAYTLAQSSLALYGQQSVAVTPNTDIAVGGRIQQNRLTARDRFDPAAPQVFFMGPEATPLDTTEVQHALHAGFEHRPTKNLAFFGRVAHAFRTPTVDERVGVAAFPVDFNLKTQTSNDREVGVRLQVGALTMQSSVYDMRLNNELYFIPFPPLGANTNLDPTRRWGSETIVFYRASDDLRFKGALTYTHATFREGIFSGNDIPLVPQWMANAGVAWNIWRNYVVFDGVVRYVGERFMDNDQRNVQPKIPGRTTLDLRLGGEIDNFFWSIAAQNIFNVLYYDYAIASTFTAGRFNAYPLPGRTFLLKAGFRFDAAAPVKTAAVYK